jgi:Rps23 Pro-64 3,4-dihydroxylase Tpa1-like proline 4-hydroxylase
LFRAALNK